MMDTKTKLILALQQTENIFQLVQNNQFTGFFASHLLPIKFELERQITNLTSIENSSKIKE